ncbi:MAG: hypothetical protein E6H51_15415 [Betaproteobacteria bacterium]|nr:MAG: hypothetical protein E6H51_15415 [Betaproteobacteria bacterium]
MRRDFTNTLRAAAKEARETVGTWLRRATARADKLRPHATKALETVKAWWIAGTNELRACAGSALGKIRTRFPMLDVTGRALRVHAGRVLQAVNSGYRAGVAAIGRVSPRTAKAIVACETWLRQSDWRRLGLTALAAVLVLGAGFAAIFPEAAGRYGRVIFTSNRIVPLPDETRRAVREKAKQLAAALDSRLDRRRKLAGETWTSAQILLALRENDPGYASRIDVKVVEQYFRSMAGPECACWRRFPQGKHPNHLGVTSWVLWTFAQYGIPAHKSELEFLLSAQGSDGGWPLFGGAQQEKFASSYGTAAAILALHEQSALQPDRQQKRRLAAAVDRGADWLKSRVVAGRARWVDYPAWPEAQGDFLGVSGFALFALHRVGAWWLGSLDRDWLRELPAQAPAALRGEASAKAVQVGNRSFPDETRYYELPWTILATEEVYRSAGIFRKVRAVQWVERALAPGASIYDLTGREKSATIVAEALLALRNEVKHE